MEQIFKYSYEEFKEQMRTIMDEAMEAYGEYLIPERVPRDRDLCVRILGTVFSYMKESSTKRKWKTSGLVRLLGEIAATNEILFMRTEDNKEDVRKVKEHLLVADPEETGNLAVFAGMVLEYFCRASGSGKDPDPTLEDVREALMDLILDHDRRMVDKTKLKIQEEEPLPVQIKKYLDSLMTGQDEAKKTVAMTVYRFLKYNERSIIMLEGSTGVGKTFLYENLASFPPLRDKLTFFSYTATQLTPNGFNGDNVEDMFKSYRKACDRRERNAPGDVENKYRGIIHIDELDKLFMSNTDSNGEDVNQVILSQLLTVIAGTTTIGDIDTADVLFILSGAFENVEMIREARKKRDSMGFISREGEGAEEDCDIRKELLRMGAPKQFLGRISRFVHLHDIDREMVRTILMDPGNGLLTRMIEMFRRDGLEIRIADDGVIEKLLDRIMESRAGVRGVKEMLTSFVGSYDYDMIEQGYKTMILDEKVLDGEPPKFEKGR